MKLKKGQGGRKQPQAPIGHSAVETGDGDGHYAKATGPRKGGLKTGGAEGPKNARLGKGPGHAYKGGGSGHYGKKVAQTPNKRMEHNAMLKGSGMGAARTGAKHNAGTFMQNLVARKSQVIRGY